MQCNTVMQENALPDVNNIEFAKLFPIEVRVPSGRHPSQQRETS